MTTADLADPGREPPVRPLYAQLWRAVPRGLGYLLPILPIVLVGTVALNALFWTGLGTLAILVGVLLLLAALFTARGLGIIEVARVNAAGLDPVQAPAWDRVARRSGTWAKLWAPFIDGHYWLYFLWGLLVAPIVGMITWTVAITWTATALVGSTYWIWHGLLPDGGRGTWWFSVPLGAPHDWLILLVMGIVAAATLPFVVRALVWVHRGIARGMLGAFRSEDLAGQVQTLTASRTAAAVAEGDALRRLERDIHDGPQQRLVRLQMDLAAAERQLSDDPDRARELIAEAMDQSKDALEELRALSRGFAPPLLLDRGMRAALEALASRNPVPVRFLDELPPQVSLPVETERNAYFIAAEAVTNATKHADASEIRLRVAIRRIPETDMSWLDVEVVDDGRGGAALVPGHGVAGLEERARGLGGFLELSSPAAGGTTISAHLPLVRVV